MKQIGDLEDTLAGFLPDFEWCPDHIPPGKSTTTSFKLDTKALVGGEGYPGTILRSESEFLQGVFLFNGNAKFPPDSRILMLKTPENQPNNDRLPLRTAKLAKHSDIKRGKAFSEATMLEM